MVEPISLTAGAIATLVLTKAFEKTGERLSEKVLEQGGKLLALLKEKSLDTASEIEKAQKQPLDMGQAHLISAVEAAAVSNPEIAEIVQAMAVEVKQHLSPITVRQVMASGIVTKGNLKAGNLKQGTKQHGSVEQIMMCDVEAESIELGDLTQEG